MKRNYIKLIMAALGTIILPTGCNDFLDKAPDERLEINTLDKIEKTVIGSYQNARSYRFTHFSSDDAGFVSRVYSEDVIIEDLYTWGNPDGTNSRRDFRNQRHQDAPSSYWLAAYGSVSQINHALEAMENIDIMDSERMKAEAVRAEALIMRSYCHFMLVNIFAKHYNTATASSDLGVPYVFKPEKTLSEKYTRESVEKTYQLAENDLTEGIALMENNFEYFPTNKYRFTMPTVYAYASRFYTFRNKDAGDVAKALEFGKKALEAYGGAGQMMPWSSYQSSELKPIDIDNQAVGMVQLSYSWLQYEWNYHLSQTIRTNVLNKNPFGLTDNRLNIYYVREGDGYAPAFYFTLNRQASGASAYDLFPIYESILNSAEASIRLGDFAAAKILLEEIGKNVYSSYNANSLTTATLKSFYKTADDTNAWISYLLYERRMMFLFQGMRWFDIKRYNLDVEHRLKDGSTILKLSETAPNKDYQIPLFAINDGMTPNN